jgi:hypothetical protein
MNYYFLNDIYFLAYEKEDCGVEHVLWREAETI